MTWRALLLVVLVLLSACHSELYSKVTEREANDMIAALSSSGIEANKQGVDGKSWSVSVAQSDVTLALQVLRSQGLPKEPYQSLGDVFKREGLVSTPSEERIRFIYAMSQELSRTLSGINGVIDARVHVVIPANDPLAEHPSVSSASVFIKYSPGVDTQAMTPAIKNLVTRSVEGLTYDNVSVSFFVAEDPPTRVRSASPKRDANWLAFEALVAVVLALALLAVCSFLPARSLALRLWKSARTAVRP